MFSNTFVLAITSGLLLSCLKAYMDYRAALRSINYHPGFCALIPSFGMLGLLFKEPRRGLWGGWRRFWRRKYLDFQEAGVDIISHIAFVPSVTTYLVLADAAAIKEVTGHRARFPKPSYEFFRIFGGNIIASEGDEWKRHRKIAAPAFSEHNNRLVWNETAKIVCGFFENVWGSQAEVYVDDVVQSLTLPMALHVISIAGFGKQTVWRADGTLLPKHKLSFQDALHVVSTDLWIRFVMPTMLLDLAPTKRIAKVKLAFEEVEQYMLELIQERRDAEKRDERHDLFSNLLDANDSDENGDGSVKLTDEELLGNIFIFMLAGHETTAHTLAFTFGLLALHSDYQEKVHQQIKSIMPDNRLPTYEEMHLFTECTAVFYETLRLFPPVTTIPKISAEDTSLVTTDRAGNRVVVPVPCGTSLHLSVVALHYNPRYWDDPYAFKPERFHGDWPREAFIPFSAGARSCLGRRFFETEGIAILTMILSRYKIELKDDPRYAHETCEERWQRVLDVKDGLTTA
uniref:Cytochrome P450 n=1 Tax=Phanerodontia chrysosporium TaxID=2822231 RepID=G5EJS6_PHACH|nr:cytochrome P450 [Phanerodontia chrysosporium]